MDKLAELRAAVNAALERMEQADTELRDAGEDADTDALTAAFDAAEAEHSTAVDKFARARKVAEARENAPVEPVEEVKSEVEERKSPEVKVIKEALTYEKHGEYSVFRDLVNGRIGHDMEANERLDRHQREMRVETQERTNPNQTANTGGEFIPPLWLQDQWVNLPRASRPIADSLTRHALPYGTNQINLPKVSTGATVAAQADAGSVSSTDITTTSVTGQVQTVAGQQDISRQLLEMSVPGFDEVVFDDLKRAYDAKIDTLCIDGAVTNAKGINQVASTNGVTFTQATPTVPLLYPKLADGVQQIHTGRFLPPSVIAMHPRRWGWILASLDSSNRPLVPPYSPMNPAGVLKNVAAENLVGNLHGLPVIVDSNIATNGGASTNQDNVFVYRAEDLHLWETETPRLKVFEEVLSGTLQIRLQIYGYYAVILGRLPKAISVISGTGLVAPTF